MFTVGPSLASCSILATLAQPNHLLLKGLICVLHRISQNADTNGMNPFNLGLCVSNSLFKTESTNISSGKQEADVMSSIVEFLILNCSSLFGSDVITCIPDKRIIVHPVPHRRKRERFVRSREKHLAFSSSDGVVDRKSRRSGVLPTHPSGQSISWFGSSHFWSAVQRW